MTYARLTLRDKPEHGPQTFLLQVTSETMGFLRGVEVKSDGDEVIKHVNGKKVDVTQHIIDKTCIQRLRPLVMHKVYGVQLMADNRDNDINADERRAAHHLALLLKNPMWTNLLWQGEVLADMSTLERLAQSEADYWLARTAEFKRLTTEVNCGKHAEEMPTTPTTPLDWRNLECRCPTCRKPLKNCDCVRDEVGRPIAPLQVHHAVRPSGPWDMNRDTRTP